MLPLLLGKRSAAGGTSLAVALGRAFAAGVVLATGLVHMLPGAMHALEVPPPPPSPHPRALAPPRPAYLLSAPSLGPVVAGTV